MGKLKKRVRGEPIPPTRVLESKKRYNRSRAKRFVRQVLREVERFVLHG